MLGAGEEDTAEHSGNAAAVMRLHPQFSDCGAGRVEELGRLKLCALAPPPGVSNGVGLLSHLRQPGQHPDGRSPGGVRVLRGLRVGQQQQPPAGGGHAGEDPAAQTGRQLRRRSDGALLRPHTHTRTHSKANMNMLHPRVASERFKLSL